MWKALISLIIFITAGYWFVNQYLSQQSSGPTPEEKAKENKVVEEYKDKLNENLEKGSERFKNLDPQNQ